jgi:hypothetical protein
MVKAKRQKRTRKAKRPRRRTQKHKGGNKKKVLVMIVGHEMNKNFVPNIVILRDFMKDYETDYAVISSSDDFAHFEGTIPMKYKEVNPKRQVAKIFEFISKYKDELNYDWFIRVRPDLKLLEPLPLNECDPSMINARARVYNGPRTIPHGLSSGGPGEWSWAKDYVYMDKEQDIILDNMIFIFGKKVVDAGAFSEVTDPPTHRDEWTLSNIWKGKNIHFNIVGINIEIVDKDGKFRGRGTDIPPPK